MTLSRRCHMATVPWVPWEMQFVLSHPFPMGFPWEFYSHGQARKKEGLWPVTYGEDFFKGVLHSVICCRLPGQMCERVWKCVKESRTNVWKCAKVLCDPTSTAFSISLIRILGTQSWDVSSQKISSLNTHKLAWRSQAMNFEITSIEQLYF